MNWLNANFIRTILGLFGGGTVLSLLVKILGCTGDNPLTTTVIEPYTCAGSEIIPLQYQAIAGFALITLGGIVKMFFKSGSVKENLVAPSVPVVKSDEARPGVVTPAQVNAGGGNK